MAEHGSDAHNVATLDLSQNAVFLNGTLDDSPRDNPNTGGVLALTPGVTSSTGTWNLNGGRIYEGTITTTGGAVLNAIGLTTPYNGVNGDNSGILDGVTLDGTLNMTVFGAAQSNSSALTIINNLVLNSTLQIDFGSTIYFVNSANLGPFGQTLSGSGSIVFGTGGTIDVANSSYYSSTSVQQGYFPSSFPLTIGAGMTIVGPQSGDTGSINGPIDNQGTIEETAGGILDINFDEYNPFLPSYNPYVTLVSWTNDTTGIIQVTSGTIEMGAAWTSKGAVIAANGTSIYLGDNWDSWQFASSTYGYDWFGTNDAWVNNSTITTNNANVFLGGWTSLDPSAKNLATLDLDQNTVFLIGTLDNSPADNPATGGVLTLTPGVTSSTGSWYLDGGRIDKGTIDAPAASLIATAGGIQYGAYQDEVDVGGGVLYGVTLDGTLDMSALAATVTVADGLTLDTNLNVSGEYASLNFDASIAQAVASDLLSMAPPST